MNLCLSTAAPAISSAAGGILSCSSGSWAPDLFGAFLSRAPHSLGYQWLFEGNEIGGATASTYTPAGPGHYTCRVTASNHAGSTSQTSTPWLIYNFSGFFQPVDNLPTLNTVKPGQGIPVKFSLGGNQGLNIFATGYPKSQEIQCDATEPTDGIEQTVTAGSSSLSYDPTANQYTYVWKTDKSWAGKCRQLVVKLNDGTTRQEANFKFSK